MKLTGAYNCVLASIYNALRINCRLEFPIQTMVVVPQLFRLYNWNHWLSSPPPMEIAEPFLARIGADLGFPETKGLDDAIQQARERLRQGEVIPASINLRYSYFDPTPFDNDFWNYQLITGVTKEDRFLMFDMYHAEAYEVDEARLRSMMDTSFNYRNAGAFTPFMELIVRSDEHAHAVLQGMNDQVGMLAAVTAYDADANLEAGQLWLDRLQAHLAKVESDQFHAEVYRLMGHLMLILKSRTQFIQAAATMGLYGDADDAFDEGWNTFVHAVPMNLFRRSHEAYSDMLTAYRELIGRERDGLNRIKERLVRHGAISGGVTS
ncbi:hypothetical protein DFQ01_103454 [Paenibacillus cellulosilyticus]|uniref:Butirosin biosynthesis protein H-like n=1 Tax=Paenibacillus cellulosilyticus TaxID=375489 RepID=A0A2V2Z6S5_9BACL|nr:hypothetical protein [Paenibacillus cellulosilyticus]PWW06550.1 hypothetical protein DFQ01_103454 [Paenibacillus cellulosilyticus]QKS46114.1 hypothetical protein HUB94_18000 [Paenibacillus cellulosilyticus]